MAAASSTSSAPVLSSSRHSDDVPQLSCHTCRERKIKCDKLDPCTNCTTAGVVCCTIYRQRLPRGRHARSSGENNGARASTDKSTGHSTRRRTAAASVSQAANQELRQRIESLESLIQNMNKQGHTPPALSRTNSDIESRLNGLGSEPINNMDLEFFSQRGSITGDVPLQISSPASSYLDRSPACIDVPTARHASFNAIYGSHSHSRSGSADGALAALGLSLSSREAETVSQPSVLSHSLLVSRLCQVYFTQVDPVLKILHRPSVERWLIRGESYLHYPERHISTQALMAAICYVTASSMTEEQTRSVLQASKCQIMDELCRACENALFNANLISTEDPAVLQAFVLYLFGKKSFDLSKATWTLVSVAVRIGENLGLHTNTEGLSFFEQQMSKRLWLTICLLDYRTALTQKSQPLVRYENMEQALMQVRHINDNDFDPSSGSVNDREELTDMTFAYVLFQHQAAGRLLNFGSAHNAESDELRQQYVHDFEEKAWAVLRFCDPESSLLAWFTWHSTQCHVAIVRVARMRPLAQFQRTKGEPAKSSDEECERLRMILRVLEKTQLMHTDMRGEGFRWYATIPWPMLATAIVECSSCTDVDLVCRGWPIMEWWYRQHEVFLTQTGNDPSQGVLGSTMQRASTKITALLNPQSTQSGDVKQTEAYPTPGGVSNGFSPFPDMSSNHYTHQSTRSNSSDGLSDLQAPVFDPLWLDNAHMVGHDTNSMMGTGMDVLHHFSPQDLYANDSF